MPKEQQKRARITACRDFVWIRPILEHVVHGIIVPDSAQDMENPREGIVVAVGSGLIEGGEIIPLSVKAGDHVYFPRNSGTLMTIEETGETYFVLRENQIFGTVDL